MKNLNFLCIIHIFRGIILWHVTLLVSTVFCTLLSGCSVFSAYCIRNLGSESIQVEIYYYQDVKLDSLIFEEEVIPMRFSRVYKLSGRIPYQQKSSKRILVDLPARSTLCFAREVNSKFGVVYKLRIDSAGKDDMIDLSNEASARLSGVQMKRDARGHTVIWYDIESVGNE